MRDRLATDQKTRLRECVLRVLARRPTEPLSVSAITFHLRQSQWLDFRFVEEDVEEALAMLEGFAFVQRVKNPLGGIENWKPSSEGILYYERNLS